MALQTTPSQDWTPPKMRGWQNAATKGCPGIGRRDLVMFPNTIMRGRGSGTGAVPRVRGGKAVSRANVHARIAQGRGPAIGAAREAHSHHSALSNFALHLKLN
jgi:hypothetical protein